MYIYIYTPTQTAICLSLRLASEWNLALSNAFSHVAADTGAGAAGAGDCKGRGGGAGIRGGERGREAGPVRLSPLSASYLRKLNDLFMSVRVCVETLQVRIRVWGIYIYVYMYKQLNVCMYVCMYVYIPLYIDN